MTDDEIMHLVAKRLQACPELRACLVIHARVELRVQAAVSLLRSGVKRAEASRILSSRFGIARRHAYRVIDQALDLTMERPSC